MFASSTIAAVAWCSPAMAQSAPSAAASEVATDGNGQLKEIVVTGEKRETKLQSAPLAITAVSSEQLEARDTRNLESLGSYVPGVNIIDNQGASFVITIRGIGYETDSNPNSFPGVAFHINGVYIAHPSAVGQSLVDVDHVEVLRGPQGTVFGETATGGAINVILKRAQLDRVSGETSLSYGNYNYVKANGSFNLPLSSTLALRVAGQYVRHDGYNYNIGVPNIPRYELDDANDVAGRAQLYWEPNDKFNAAIDVEGFHTSTHGPLQKLVSLYVPGIGGAPGRYVSDTTPDFRAENQLLPSSYLLNTRMAYLTLNYNASDTVALKSVTAYQYMFHSQVSSSDRTNDPGISDSLKPFSDKSKTFSQEISASSRGNQFIDWTVGALYLRQRASQNISEVGSQNPTDPNAFFIHDPANPSINYIFYTQSPYQHTSVGVYGQGIAHLSDSLTVTAGARYNWDKVTAQPVQDFNAFGLTLPRESKSTAVTGKLSIDYKITPTNSVYVTGSYGYKPAGVSFVPNTGPIFVKPTFKKETVRAIEFGSKNEFFDRTVRLNAAAYYYWLHDYQFTAEDPLPFQGGTSNIPRAEMWGAEFEATWKVTPQFTLDGNLSINRGKFTSDLLTVNPQTAVVLRNGNGFSGDAIAAVLASAQNVRGNKVPKIPQEQANVSATYEQPIGQGTATLRGEMSYRSAYDYLLFNAPTGKVPARTIFNLYAAYQPNEGPWKVSLTVTNLTNKKYLASKFADPYGSFANSVQVGAPRQIFGTVAFKF
jgi:iron complex outermembrane receptor protein